MVEKLHVLKRENKRLHDATRRLKSDNVKLRKEIIKIDKNLRQSLARIAELLGDNSRGGR